MLPWRRRRAAARRVRKVIANSDSTTVPQRGPAVSRIPERYGVRIYARVVVRRGFRDSDGRPEPRSERRFDHPPDRLKQPAQIYFDFRISVSAL